MAVFLLLMVVFSAIPLVIDLWNMPNKDYSLWYQVGVALRQGMDIYPDPATGRLFPFMYPPSAAAILGFLCPLGKHGTTLVLVLAHSVAWVGAIVLSVWLATGGKGKRSIVIAGCSTRALALHHCPDPQHLPAGPAQPHAPDPAAGGLRLPAIGARDTPRAFSSPRRRPSRRFRSWPWATSSTAGCGVPRWRRSQPWLVWLLVVPLPFRTPAQAVSDLAIWSRGNGLHLQLARNRPAARIARTATRISRSWRWPIGSFAMCQPMARRCSRKQTAEHFKGQPMPGHAGRRLDRSGRDADRPPADGPRWDNQLEESEPALQRAWRVNFASFDFRSVTVITLTAMLGLSLFVVAVFPPSQVRTPRTDALEFALVTLLIVMFSPLSFNYAYVWLIFPLTVALHGVQATRPEGRWRKLELAWIAAVFFIPSLAVVMPLYAQAYGNLFVPALSHGDWPGAEAACDDTDGPGRHRSWREPLEDTPAGCRVATIALV